MSALTSTIAVALVGRLDVGEGVLHLALPRRVGAEREAPALHPLLVEHDELLGDLARPRSGPGSWPWRSRAAEAVQRRRLAADVLAQRVDLVGRHVELVVALVLEQQVVALDAADRALDHAVVAADAVLVVDDVVAGLEVLEERRRRRAAGRGRRWARRRPVRSVSATTASLAAGSVTPRCSGATTTCPPGSVEVAGVAAIDAAGRGRGRGSSSARRSAEPVAVGGDDDAVAARRAARASRATRPAPSPTTGPSPTPRTTGVSGRLRAPSRASRPRRVPAEQAVGLGVQAGERLVGVAAPRRRQRAGQVVLLGEQVGGPVAHAARLDEHDLGVVAAGGR